MSSIFVSLPPSGSNGYLGAYADFASLPTTANDGDVAFNQTDMALYYYDAGAMMWKPVAEAAGALSHSALANLTADDHPQYLLTNGGRVLTGNWAAGAFSATFNSVVVGNAANQISGLNSILSAGFALAVPVLGAGDTIVARATVDTLSNKTLTLADSSIGGGGNYQTAVFSAAGLLTSVATGTSGQFLKSAGAATLPAYSSIVQADISGLTTASTPTFASLVLTNGITANATGSAYGAGKIFENSFTEVASLTTTGVGATGVWGAVTSQALGAGIWMVWGVSGLFSNGAALTDFLQTAITTSSTASGVTDNETAKSASLSQGASWFTPVPTKIFSFASPTTVYLNTLFNYTSGTPQHQGRLQWMRIG